jgi:hypothetical protein
MLFVVMMVSPPSICFGQTTGGALESQVKAAYIYNFTKFVYWDAQKPDTSKNPIVVALFGADSIGDILSDFSKKQTGGRPILVKKLIKDKIDTSDCQVVFIGRLMHQQLPALIKKLEGTNILTVSDMPGFTRQGGMIGFFIEDDKVKIEVNMDAVNNANLKISAKLLEVAKITSREK